MVKYKTGSCQVVNVGKECFRRKIESSRSRKLPITRSKPKRSCYKKTTLLPLNQHARMISTVLIGDSGTSLTRKKNLRRLHIIYFNRHLIALSSERNKPNQTKLQSREYNQCIQFFQQKLRTCKR